MGQRKNKGNDYQVQQIGMDTRAIIPQASQYSIVVFKIGNVKVCEYDQEIPQSHTADQPRAP